MEKIKEKGIEIRISVILKGGRGETEIEKGNIIEKKERQKTKG